MITNYQRRILERMQAGERLCKRYTEEGQQCFFANGDVVRVDSVASLFNSGIIRHAEDGMFGDGQTYEINFMPEA
jgi:hypothetical protein